MKSVEEAYQELGRSVVDFIQGRPWTSGTCTCQIYSKMASSTWKLENNGVWDDKAMGWGDSSIDSGKAALFLRDDLLQKTGRRIWGLTFTLYPNGKFTIEYDYHKPEGFEETDETIRAADAWGGWVKENNKDGQE